MFQNIKNYTYSISLFILILFYILIKENISILKESIEFLLNVNWIFFIIGGLMGFVAALSFAIPFSVLLYYKKIKFSFLGMLSFTLRYVCYDVLGRDTEKFFGDWWKLKENETHENFVVIKSMDILAIILLSPFPIFFIDDFQIRNFFIAIFIIESLFTMMFLVYNKDILSKKRGSIFVSLVGATIIRYILEFPRTLFIIFAVNHFIEIPIIICFLLSTSVLYFIPKFRGAGGLLEVYLMIFYPLLGGTQLDGFLLSGLFRISGLLFFALPTYLYIKFFQLRHDRNIPNGI